MLTLAVPLAVLVCSGVATVLLLGSERDNAARQRTAAAQKASVAVKERIATTISRLSTTGGLFVASTEVTPAEFRKFTSTLVRDRAIETVNYIDRVPAAERAAFERRIGVPIVDGSGAGVRPAPKRREYFPYYLLGKRPDTPRENTRDAAGEPVRASALRQARDSGTAQTTAPITTFDDGVRALIIFVPVYQSAIAPTSVAKRRRTLRGYSVGILPISRLLPAHIGSVSLTDQGRRIAGSRDLENATTVPVIMAGRPFGLRVQTGIGTNSTLAVAMAAGGLLLALAIFTVMAMLLRRDAYAQRLVRLRLGEQRKAEAALDELERRHRLLAEYASDWITVVDANGICTYSSPSVRALLGREPEEIVGGTFTDLLHPDSLDSAAAVMRAIGRGEDPPSVEMLHRHADGHWVPFEISLTVARDETTGEVVEVFCASRDVTERHGLEAELRSLADNDALTGLPNRRGLTERLEAELALARRYGGGALLLMDLDEFKEVNDTLGHATGDRVLCRVADVLRERSRETDHVMRLGGDEFAAVLPRADSEAAERVAQKMITSIREDAELRRLFGRPVTASVGIALMTEGPSLSAEKLLINADLAMYAAKRAGRDRGGRAPVVHAT
jgi:diguanylate cyclase (GGDEF)-like protein/PAS domain S-box-containing protein